MKVVQVIDSLALGGAERVAVNLANALSQEPSLQVFLCATRAMGPLEDFVVEHVQTLCLHKKASWDVAAFWRFRKFLRKQRIDVVHAHSSSLFWAVCATLGTPAKVVWHIHNGASQEMRAVVREVYKVALHFVPYVFAANRNLAQWALQTFDKPNNRVAFLPNFPVLSPANEARCLPASEKIRIVSLANLRNPKDHLTLLRAFEHVADRAELYMVGRYDADAYYEVLVAFIAEHGLQDAVHILGARMDVADILSQCDVGVLSSAAEGLPVSLLEYGMAGLPVVCTHVGECAAVLGNGAYGILVSPKDPDALAAGLRRLIEAPALRTELGKAFQEEVARHYSPQRAVSQCLSVYTSLTKEPCNS